MTDQSAPSAPSPRTAVRILPSVCHHRRRHHGEGGVPAIHHGTRASRRRRVTITSTGPRSTATSARRRRPVERTRERNPPSALPTLRTEDVARAAFSRVQGRRGDREIDPRRSRPDLCLHLLLRLASSPSQTPTARLGEWRRTDREGMIISSSTPRAGRRRTEREGSQAGGDAGAERRPRGSRRRSEPNSYTGLCKRSRDARDDARTIYTPAESTGHGR